MLIKLSDERECLSWLDVNEAIASLEGCVRVRHTQFSKVVVEKRTVMEEQLMQD
jgi:hypothetical protein